MAQEIEIEFKNVLTKEQYEQLLQFFNVQSDQILRQTNYYFDTPNWDLRTRASALRIRQKDDRIVCTLKERSSSENVHIETTDPLTKEQSKAMLSGSDFLAPNVKEKLLQYNIPIDQLQMFGSITTDRVEIPYKGGTLVFDHSFYLQQEDYEVEYETSNEQEGSIIFTDFLKQHKIEINVAEKKIARFMSALNAQKG